jgi:hypothetical protein
VADSHQTVRSEHALRVDGKSRDLAGLRLISKPYLDFDLPPDFHEILRRNVEQVHRPDGIAEHQRE